MLVGDYLRITVDENPSTGYSWVLNVPEPKDMPDYVIFSVDTDDFKQIRINRHDVPMVGIGGTRIITILAENEGVGQLEMAYVRSWEFKGFD